MAPSVPGNATALHSQLDVPWVLLLGTHPVFSQAALTAAPVIAADKLTGVVLTAVPVLTASVITGPLPEWILLVMLVLQKAELWESQEA